MSFHRSPNKINIQKKYLSNLNTSPEKARFTTSTFRSNLTGVLKRHRKNKSMGLESDFNRSTISDVHKSNIDSILINCSEALIGEHAVEPLLQKLLPKHIRTRHRHMLTQISGKSKDSAEYVNFAFLYYSY
jgi:hypothetical protein